MIRDLSQIAATGAKTMGLLAGFWLICNGFVLLDWWVSQ